MARTPAPARAARKKKHPRDPEQSRKALLAAAAKLFNTVGYHGTDSNRIARAAGYAPGTFYSHFPDKLSIFLAVYEGWVNEEWVTIGSVLAAPSGTRPIRSRVTEAVLKHHRQWRTFRANLRALCATDEQARSARLAQRERQISLLEQQMRTVGRSELSRGEIWYILLAFEVVCDSIADGDAAALGVPEAELIGKLEEVLAPLIR